jgi:hypothetical protein
MSELKEEVVVAVAPPAAVVKKSAVKPFIEKVPAQWFIRQHPEDEDLIVATAYTTQEHFEGTMADFNACMRG